MASEKQLYIGLDVHKNFIVGCAKNKEGKIIFERKFKSEPNDMDKFLMDVPLETQIAIESSSCWQYVYDYLSDKGFDLALSNPTKTRLIGESKKKTDWEDARKLADLLRMNMLPLCYAAPADVRIKRQITRHRHSLVSMKTQLKNQIHAILRRHGIKNEILDYFTQQGIEYLQSLDLPMCDRFELDNFIGLLRHHNTRIEECNKRIEEIARDDPYSRILCTHPGIGYYSAITIIGEIGDIRRFHSAKQLTSFAGLNPSVSQSGDHCYLGRISKQGNKNLRWILIECSNITIGYDKELKSYYMKKKLGKGHNKAIVAVARKLLVRIYIMMKHNIKYHALRINKAT